jgi:beta-propeller repeat-containing protein/FIMAH domain-containing protein
VTPHQSWIRSFARVLVFALVMPFPTGHAAAPAPSAARPQSRPSRAVRPAIGTRLPLRFERALDDASGRQFVARGAGYVVGVTDRGATLLLHASGSKVAAVDMRLVGSRDAASVTARKPLAGVTNHLTGSDARRWHVGVAGHAEVEYRDVYPGVSVVYYGNEGQLEYDFVVAPGAMHSPIALAFDGAKTLHIDSAGQLVIATDSADLIQKTPVLYQEIDGARHRVEGGYTVRDNGTVGFTIGKYDPNYALVIDPVLSYSTYLGGSGQERADGVAIDAAGNIVVVGETYSADFPTVAAAQGAAGFGDVFVAKLTPSGDALVYATYLAGHARDFATGVDVDAAGNAYVVGATFSFDFPTVNAVQSAHHGGSDSFVAKLDPSGALVYCTLLGGESEDYGYGIAVDAQGRAHIAGSTFSTSFPTVNPTQAALGGNPAYRTLDGGETWSGVRTGLNTIAVWSFAFDPVQPSTIYAGTQAEGVFRSDDSGTTWTRTSVGVPFSPVYALAAAGDSTTLYAGTPGGVFRSHDRGETWTLLDIPLPITSLVLAADETLYAGSAYYATPGVLKSRDGGDTWLDTDATGDVQALAVSGTTVYASTGEGVFRTANGQDWIRAAGLPPSTFVRAVDPVVPSIAYAGGVSGLFKTTSGGADWMKDPFLEGVAISAVAVAPSDPATIVVGSSWGGMALSHDGGSSWQISGPPELIPNTFAIHPQLATTVYTGGQRTRDAFAATLSAGGGSLEFSTYLGGSKADEATGIAIDADGNTYIAGNTQSQDFPVLHPVQPGFGGTSDVFVVKISATGVLTYATYLGGSGSEYHARIGVDADGQAHVAGVTWSMSDFPVRNAYQPAAGGGFADVFVSVLNDAGDGFVYSTYLGGSDKETDGSQSLGPVLAVTPSGDTYVTGTTQSADFPTTADAIQATRAGVNDGFVARLDPSGQLKYSTFIGGSGEDNPRGVAVDAGGAVVVAGYTSSADWPLVSALQPALAGPDDGFIARIAEDAIPSDTIAPETTIATSGSQGSSGWYRSAVDVTLSAADNPDGAGVQTIEYALGAGAFHPYSGPFTLTANDVVTVTARALDMAGNVESPAKSTTVRIDTASPRVTASSPEARDYLHSEAVTLAVSATDALSGVAPGSVHLTLDGTDRAIGEAISPFGLSLGAHTMVASASDAAGNTSQSTVTFRVIATFDSLRAAVNGLADNRLIEDAGRKTLLIKLADAQQTLQRGNVGAARDKLQEVIEYCKDQRGKKLTAEAADLLVADTRYVLGGI